MMDVAGGILRGEVAGSDLVSVMVPAFNAESTIVETLNSVWAQTYRPIELIIVNDGSTDGTRDLIARWAEAHRVSDFTTVVIDQENQGLIKSRARGWSTSQGAYLQFLDADDLLHAEKLARCVPRLGPAMADVVVPRTEKFVEESDVRGLLETPPRKIPWTTRELDHVTITRVWWHSVGPLFSRRIVERVGPFQSEVPPYAEELDFHGRIKLTTRRVDYVDEVLNFYRKGSPSALTGALSKVYSGRIQSAHVACDLLRGFRVRDRHEWTSLFAMCFRTYYQTVCCTNDREVQDQAWQSLREVAGQCSAPLKMTRLIPRPLLDVAFRGAHRLRQSVGAH